MSNYQGKYNPLTAGEAKPAFKESGTYTAAVPGHVLGKLHTIQSVLHSDKALSWVIHWCIEQQFKRLLNDIREENNNA
jgi:hypothetical protein